MYKSNNDFYLNFSLERLHFEKAREIVEYTRETGKGQGHNYLCIVGNEKHWFAQIHFIGEPVRFKNNGTVFYFGEVVTLNTIDDFERNVIRAINTAETSGGSYYQKALRFIQVFPGIVNVIVSNKKEAQAYYYYQDGYHFRQTRGCTTYEAWV